MSHFQKNNQLYNPQGTNYDYMSMMSAMQNPQDLNDLYQINSQKKLDKNSSVFVPGGQQNNAYYPPQNQNNSSAAVNFLSGQQQGPNMVIGNNMMGINQQQMQQVYGQNIQVQKLQKPLEMKYGMPQPEFDSQSLDPHSLQGGKIDKTEADKAYTYIANLKEPELKDEALKELNHRRDQIPNLAPILWHSIGTVAILLQEIISIYPYLAPPTLSQNLSERTCNVLGLFQCIALNSDTRPQFLQANLHLYLYPLINTSSKQRPFEHLRVTSLGVIGAQVKGEDSEAINFLMNTELIVLCLRIMKRGNELSRTVATFIVQKIQLDNNGLEYVCQTGERLFAVAQILKDIIEDIAETGKDDQRLLRHIVRCLLRLSENPKASSSLAKFVPKCVRDVNTSVISDDQVKKWHHKLLKNLKLI